MPLVQSVMKCVFQAARGLRMVSLVCLTLLGTRAYAGLDAVVTIPPLKGLLEPLLPAGSTVRVLMPPGRSEHNYEFTPADLAATGNADLVLIVGLGLESRVEGFLSSHVRTTRVDVELAAAAGVEGQETCDGAHGDKSDDGDHAGHTHTVDPHVWLDPALVKIALPKLAEAVERALTNKGQWNAEARAALASALANELKRVTDVEAAYAEALKPFAGQKIVTHHAAFGRLAERYGLVIAAVIRMNEGEEPTPGRIAAIVQAVRKEKVRAIFVEPQFDATTAERVARAAGVRLLKIDPLGDGDWFAMMAANLGALKEGLSP